MGGVAKPVSSDIGMGSELNQENTMPAPITVVIPTLNVAAELSGSLGALMEGLARLAGDGGGARSCSG